MLKHGSLKSIGRDLDLTGFDAVAMVEIIEHMLPTHLSIIEQTVFKSWRPGILVISTPNKDYNTLLGIPEQESRHRDHHFEWSRVKFQMWAVGVANRSKYQVRFYDLGTIVPGFGSLTQMAVFARF